MVEDMKATGPAVPAAPTDEAEEKALARLLAGVSAIGVDGDDTLWHNEILFAGTQDRLVEIVGRFRPGDPDGVRAAIYTTETRNLRLFGYGIKGYMLSMIETALEVTDYRIDGRAIEEIIAMGKAMLEHPAEPLEGVPAFLRAAAANHRLILITKGDLFDQENKISRSGLAEHFEAIEIVSEKDPETYRRILERHGIAASEFLMVGNSRRSDIEPVLALGGRAAHVPYHITWQHEEVAATEQSDSARVLLLDSLAPLTEWLRRGNEKL